MKNERVLFVDDDPKILSAFERRFEDSFDSQVAEGPIEAIRIVEEKGPFAVVVSDMRMPEMTGIELLTRIHKIHSDTVRLMLTGYADLESTMDAVNRGQIFRILSKPCDFGLLHNAIVDGINQYRLVKSEKELVEGTLMGSVKVLSEVLGLVNPATFGRASRVQRIATAIANCLDFPNIWELRIAAMLCEIGCVALPVDVLDKISRRADLTDQERESYMRHPDIGRSLLSNIPRLQNVAEMVAYQAKNFDGSGYPFDRVRGDEIPLGARILKVALDYDVQEVLTDDPFEAFANMNPNADRYDPNVMAGLENVLEPLSTLERRSIQLSELQNGMILAKDICGQHGQLLVSTGQEITPSVLRFLLNYAEHSQLKEPFIVLCQSGRVPELIKT